MPKNADLEKQALLLFAEVGNGRWNDIKRRDPNEIRKREVFRRIAFYYWPWERELRTGRRFYCISWLWNAFVLLLFLLSKYLLIVSFLIIQMMNMVSVGVRAADAEEPWQYWLHQAGFVLYSRQRDLKTARIEAISRVDCCPNGRERRLNKEN